MIFSQSLRRLFLASLITLFALSQPRAQISGNGVTGGSGSGSSYCAGCLFQSGLPFTILSSGWIDAKATFGAVYFGGTIAYVSGDDPATTEKREGGTLTGGRDWSPNLIMWNYDRSMWIGSLNSSATTTAIGTTATAVAGNAFGTTGMTNALLYQGRVGVTPTDKLDIMASFTYATADKAPVANWVSKDYGYEFDVTATYKLTSNLTYMLGAGYLWTGDYFKGTDSANQVQNDYLVINKLTLTF